MINDKICIKSICIYRINCFVKRAISSLFVCYFVKKYFYISLYFLTIACSFLFHSLSRKEYVCTQSLRFSILTSSLQSKLKPFTSFLFVLQCVPLAMT